MRPCLLSWVSQAALSLGESSVPHCFSSLRMRRSAPGSILRSLHITTLSPSGSSQPRKTLRLFSLVFESSPHSLVPTFSVLQRQVVGVRAVAFLSRLRTPYEPRWQALLSNRLSSSYFNP